MELDALLRAHGLDCERDFLRPFAQLEIALVPDDTARSGRGATRLGGGADAPADFVWPCQRWPLTQVAHWPDYVQERVADARSKSQVREEQGHLVMPLSFLLQIDLAELRAFDPQNRLPARGTLLFFASSGTDLADPLFAKRVAAAVCWIDCPRDQLQTHPQPPTPDPFPTAAVPLRPERRLRLALDWEDSQALRERLLPAQKSFVDQAMTHTDALFAAPAEECSGPMPPPGYTALLRVIDHAAVDLHLGDASWLTFAIPTADLVAGRFAAACASVFIG